MQRSRSWSEDEHVKPLTYESQRLEASLAVVSLGIFSDKRTAPIKSERKTERYAPFGHIARVLGRVEGTSISVIVSTIKRAWQPVIHAGREQYPLTPTLSP